MMVWKPVIISAGYGRRVGGARDDRPSGSGAIRVGGADAPRAVGAAIEPCAAAAMRSRQDGAMTSDQQATGHPSEPGFAGTVARTFADSTPWWPEPHRPRPD